MSLIICTCNIAFVASLAYQIILIFLDGHVFLHLMLKLREMHRNLLIVWEFVYSLLTSFIIFLIVS